jgi:putative cell wall-binding protein
MARRLVVVSAAVLAVLAAVLAAPATADPALFRQSGSDRYGTAAAVSSKAFPDGADNVFLASGTSFPDALAGASYASALKGPILLLTHDALPNATAGEIDRLHPSHITILGGTSAVSATLAQAIAQRWSSASVARISGTDRFATAVEVSHGFDAPVPAVYVANGLSFPDALAGGAALGGTTGGPVLLVTQGSLPPVTKAEIERLAPTNIFVLGGSSAVSDAVVAELAPLAPNTPIRRAGADRYETAVQVAGAFSSAPVVYLARGDQFPDALAAGAAAAVRRGPILLTRPDCIPFDVDLAIQRLNPEQVIVLGGTSALSDAVLARTRC